MDFTLMENKLKENMIDVWSTHEHLCLTSAVLRNGDQNWVAVSRAIRQISNEANRPLNWYSTKNCSIQYSKLLEQVGTLKRKREKDDEPFTELPQKTIYSFLSKKRKEELTLVMEESKIAYAKLYEEISQIKTNKLQGLHETWEEIMKEQDQEDEEKEELQNVLKLREEKIKQYQQSTQVQLKGLQSKTNDGTKSSTNESDDMTNSLEENSVKMDESESQKDGSQSSAITSKSTPHDAEKNSDKEFDKNIRKGNEESELDTSRIKEEPEETEDDEEMEHEEESDLKTPDNTLDEMPKPGDSSSFESNIILDYVSNLNSDIKDEDNIMPSDEEKKLLDSSEVEKKSDSFRPQEAIKDLKTACVEMSVSASRNLPMEEDSHKSESDSDGDGEVDDVADEHTTKNKRQKQLSESSKDSETFFSSHTSGVAAPAIDDDTSSDMPLPPPPTSSVQTSAAHGFTPISARDVLENSRALPKKEPRDEYDFDDDASRESNEVKEYMSRSEKRKFFSGECSIASPVISESTPSSPASTNYGDDPEAEKALRSWKRSVMLLWNDIAAHKNASLFLKAITEEKVPGYHSIVYRPLDLMTIKRHIENGSIRTTRDFQRDVMLMLINAQMYNTNKNNIYRMAGHMLTDALDIIEEFINTQMMARVVEASPKTLRRETRESSAKRAVEETTPTAVKRRSNDRDEKSSKRRKN